MPFETAINVFPLYRGTQKVKHVVEYTQNFLGMTKSFVKCIYTGLGFVPGPIILDENGGSGQICVIKRGGIVPSDGLTVELRFFQFGGSPLAG